MTITQAGTTVAPPGTFKEVNMQIWEMLAEILKAWVGYTLYPPDFAFSPVYRCALCGADECSH